MPVMLLLPFFPLATVLMGMVVVTSVKPTEFTCADIAQDCLDCDVCWCYEEGGFACCCCTVCHDVECDDDMLYDDSSDSFLAYAKKS